MHYVSSWQHKPVFNHLKMSNPDHFPCKQSVIIISACDKCDMHEAEHLLMKRLRSAMNPLRAIPPYVNRNWIFSHSPNFTAKCISSSSSKEPSKTRSATRQQIVNTSKQLKSFTSCSIDNANAMDKTMKNYHFIISLVSISDAANAIIKWWIFNEQLTRGGKCPQVTEQKSNFLFTSVSSKDQAVLRLTNGYYGMIKIFINTMHRSKLMMSKLFIKQSDILYIMQEKSINYYLKVSIWAWTVKYCTLKTRLQLSSYKHSMLATWHWN